MCNLSYISLDNDITFREIGTMNVLFNILSICRVQYTEGDMLVAGK